MFYRTGCYRHAPNLRTRPIEEMKSCVVFRQYPPKLLMLNLNAWLIFEVCDGVDALHLEQTYVEHLPQNASPTDARQHLIDGLNYLEAQGLLVFCPS